MTKKELKKLDVGDYILYGDINTYYKVIHIYKSGILAYEEWENSYGKFHESKFITYAELLEDKGWQLIN